MKLVTNLITKLEKYKIDNYNLSIVNTGGSVLKY